MYWDSWFSPPRPGGSYATHPAHAIFHGITVGVFVVDLLLQAYTVNLMWRVATKQLREYRYFMMLCTAWDICFATSFGLLFQPRPLGPIVACATAQGLVSSFGDDGVRIGFVALHVFGTALIASQYYSLVFRIVAVLPSPNARRLFLAPPCTVFLLALIATATALVGYGVYRITDERSDYDALLVILSEKEYLAADNKGIACFNFTTPHGTAILAAIAFAFAASQTFFGLCAAWAMIRLRRKTAQMSERTRQMQLQFVRLLLLQMLSPVACAAVPVLYLFYNFFLGEPVPLVALYLILLALSLFPMVNAVLTIVFVRPYRQHTLQLIRIFTKGHGEVDTQVSWVSSTTQRPAFVGSTRQVARLSVA